MKVVYNACYGGFGLSSLALELLSERKGECITCSYYVMNNTPRDDADLVAVVEQLGKKASGSFSRLMIEEIPDGVDYEIDDYDGFEEVLPPRMEWEDMIKDEL